MVGAQDDETKRRKRRRRKRSRCVMASAVVAAPRIVFQIRGQGRRWAEGRKEGRKPDADERGERW